jgi:D-alanyl-D-alanine carboxypeptidase (penicillin-binding protein 5/6)
VGAGAPPLPAGLSSASWLVADLTNGQVLAAQAGSAKRAPASTLKILTALTFGPGAPEEIQAAAPDLTVTGRRVGLVAGVRYRSTDLLDALFVASGNDVAQVLAGSGGDPSSVADRMASTARDLGALDTTPVNATGLDAEGQLTTPFDLAILTRAALAVPALRTAAGLSQMTLTGSDGKSHHLSSGNPLLGRYPGVIGVKTGSTAEAGQTFVGAADRNGRTLAVVLMEAPSAYGTEATALLDWGFRAAGSTQPVALLPAPTAHSAANLATDSEPPAAPLPEDGGGVSPLLALALALTVVAAAFTYWQGREPGRRPPPERALRPPTQSPDAGSPAESRLPESRNTFAP